MSVRETRTINIEYNPVSGRKMLNRYEIYGELGRGQHGKVKLGRDTENEQFVAIKTVDRKGRPRLGRPSTSTTETKVRQEIAILKKCKHPNVVQLLEVLDDQSSRKIYLVLEYLEKGEVQWQTNDNQPALSPARAREVMVDTLMGLEYLHSHGIIHRDIKPANLLLSRHGVVKISDFGVSYAFTAQDCDELEMAKTVGSPAFFAPEMCIFDEKSTVKPRITGKIDVWALGVTLFCLLYGYLPFDAENGYELFQVISKQPLELPPAKSKDMEQANDLLCKLLEKDPAKRIDITQIRYHPWLARNVLQVPAQPAKTRVSDEEVDHAVRGIASRIKSSFSRLLSRSRSGGRESAARDMAGSPPNGPLVGARTSRKERAQKGGDLKVPNEQGAKGAVASGSTKCGPQPSAEASVQPSVPLDVSVAGSPSSSSSAGSTFTNKYIPSLGHALSEPKEIESEPTSGKLTPNPNADLPHTLSSPGRINLPTSVYTPKSLRYPSNDTLNAPGLPLHSSSESDSDSDGGRLEIVIGRKRNSP